MKSKITNNKIIIVLLIITIFFLPNALTIAPQTSQIAIVTAMGIDNSAEGIELSAQIIVPKFESGFNKNLEVVSATGTNLLNALNTMSINLGKKIGLAHLRIVVIADNIATEQNIATLLTPLLKNGDKNTNAVLISTTSSAKEVLRLGSGLNNSYNFSLSSITEYSDHLLLGGQSKLQNFLTLYKKNASANLLGVVSVDKTNGEGLIEAVGEDASSTQTTKTLLNEGSVAIFKQGQKMIQITKRDFQNFAFFLSGAKDITFSIDNVLDDFYSNETVDVTIKNSRVKRKTSFKFGAPRMHLTNTFEIELERQNINNEDQKTTLTTQLKNNIITYIKLNMAGAFNFCKDNNVDVFNFYDSFYAYENSQFKDYLLRQEDRNYLEKVELFASFNLVLKS